ncbi:3'(2'),5'-bisphosphate nucleotidase CysQ [Mannheimia haemolytica]
MQTLTQPLLENIINIAKAAGEQLKQLYARSVAIKIKADCTPVTEADLIISQFLTERLKQLTPDIPVLSEEFCDIPFAERQQWNIGLSTRLTAHNSLLTAPVNFQW